MIKNKNIDKLVAVMVSLAMIFTVVLMYCSATKASTVQSGGVSKAYESLMNKDNVMTVDIVMNDSDWQKMLDNAMDEEYTSCDVVINGVKYKNVGIRPKGNTSLSQIASDDTTDRYSFALKFDKYVDNQTCMGLDKMLLNNIMSDTTYMKEYLSYDMLSYLGAPAPLYSYAQINVNGEAWGLYLALEGIDESFAERNFGDDYGQLYKPETTNFGGGDMEKMDESKMGEMKEPPEKMEQNGQIPQPDMQPSSGEQSLSEAQLSSSEQSQSNAADINTDGVLSNSVSDTAQSNMAPDGMQFPPDREDGGDGMAFGDSNGADLKYTDDDIDSYSAIFDSAVFDAKNTDYKRVIEALKNLSEGKDLEKYIDVENTLKYFAVNTFVVNLDCYLSNLQHNYYLYEKNGQLCMIGWDFNLAFAGFQAGDASSAINLAIDTPTSGISVEDRPMFGALIAVDEYKQLYHSYLQQLVDGYVNSGLFDTTASSVYNLIKDYVANDATAFYTFDEFQTGYNTLLKFVKLRAESVAGQIAGTIPSTNDGQQADSSNLISGDDINIKDMGTQGMDDKMGDDNMKPQSNTEGNNTKPQNSVGDNKTQPQNNAGNDNTKPQSNTGENEADSQNDINGDKTQTQNPDDNMPEKKGMGMGMTPQKKGMSNETVTEFAASAILIIAALIFARLYKRRKYN